MSASDDLENGLMLLLFNNTALAEIGDASGLQPSAAAGSLYCSLHTGDPGEAGDQTTNECTYTSYARVAVDRDGSHWTVTANKAENAAEVAFPEATGGSESATHFGIGTASSGAGKLLFSGALGSPLAISSGITPTYAAGDLYVTAD
jgi:hypothetical protein